MKKYLYLSLICLLTAFSSNAQIVVFSDDFESGLANWTVTGLWNTTTEAAFSPNNSFTDSPGGNYLDVFSSEATMAVDIDLSAALDADVQLEAQLDLENGFDYVYMDASTDGGGAWTNIYVFNGEDLITWTHYAIPIGAFVGSPNVRLRFRFESDAAYNADGIHFDDIVVRTYNVDASPPLILHTATNLYEGTLGPNNLTAELIDASDIASTSLWYSADGGAYTAVAGINVVDDTYVYEVPELAPGTWVSYYIEATDDFFMPNTAISPTYEYIAGNYVGYDDGAIDFVADIGTLSLTGYVSAAVRVTLTGETDVVTAIIQNYTDYMRPNDPIQFHVWADDGTGYPGADLIAPFYVTPEPTLDEPNRGTRVDLRGTVELEGIYGDVFVGYTVPGGLAWLSYTSTLVTNRTFMQTGFGWTEFFGDIHFRVVTSALTGAPEALYSYTAVAEPLVNFTDLSTNSPTSWYWDFADGTTSTLENPVHTFLSNGSFNVCLTATNAIASDTYCDLVLIDIYATPVANFSFAGDPTVTFTDLSLNEPTSWAWDFGDGATSTLQDPIHTYATDGTFEVCLEATNTEGSATVCKDVTIGNTPKVPVVDFSYSISGTNVTFTDLSTNTPDYWSWDFGDGTTSAIQNPSHFYAVPEAVTVCLTAGNVAGENFTCKIIDFNSINSLNNLNFTIAPNPADALINIDLPLAITGNGLVINNLGQTMFSFLLEGKTNINVANLPEGLYFIQIEADGATGTQAFVIQH